MSIMSGIDDLIIFFLVIMTLLIFFIVFSTIKERCCPAHTANPHQEFRHSQEDIWSIEYGELQTIPKNKRTTERTSFVEMQTYPENENEEPPDYEKIFPYDKLRVKICDIHV